MLVKTRHPVLTVDHQVRVGNRTARVKVDNPPPTVVCQ